MNRIKRTGYSHYLSTKT